MAMVIMAGLHLFRAEQVASRDVKPTGERLDQLLTGDRETIHITAAGKWIPGVGQQGEAGNQHRSKKQCRPCQQKFAVSFPLKDALEYAPARGAHSLRPPPRCEEGNEPNQQTN
jgi:hypothetical protein